MQNIVLETYGISKYYKPEHGIGPVNIKLEEGKIYTFMGPNAAGKTTLLKCLCGIEIVDSGSIYYRKDILQHKHLLNAVFQMPEPWPHLSIRENLSLALKLVKGLSEKEINETILETSVLFGIEDRLDKLPHELSGGLKQRVVIARSFCMNPQIIFLDEPTSALDPEWTDIFVNILKVYRDKKKCIVVITHQINFLKKISDYTFFINKGLIVEEGQNNSIINEPNSTSLKKFLANI